MNLPFTVTQNELSDLLLNISPTRPVFIWGAPGIGKSALVQKFADDNEISDYAKESVYFMGKLSGYG